MRFCLECPTILDLKDSVPTSSLLLVNPENEPQTFSLDSRTEKEEFLKTRHKFMIYKIQNIRRVMMILSPDPGSLTAEGRQKIEQSNIV